MDVLFNTLSGGVKLFCFFLLKSVRVEGVILVYFFISAFLFRSAIGKGVGIGKIISDRDTIWRT